VTADPPVARAPAVLRAAGILDAFVDTGSRVLGVNELARLLDAPKSSISNICAALDSIDALQRDETGYRLGRRLAEWGGAFLDSHDYLDRFNDIVTSMPAIGAETVQVAVLVGVEVVYIARSDGHHPVRLSSAIGRKLPAISTATGKALLARLEDEELSRRLANVASPPPITPHSIRSEADLRHELASVRASGYAVDDQEMVAGVQCVAIAMDNPRANDDPIAISCTYLASRATPEFIDSIIDDLVRLKALLTDPFEARQGATGKDTES
jgi:IclR family transcriptional regulator, blcABC operon repressor